MYRERYEGVGVLEDLQGSTMAVVTTDCKNIFSYYPVPKCFMELCDGSDTFEATFTAYDDGSNPRIVKKVVDKW